MQRDQGAFIAAIIFAVLMLLCAVTAYFGFNNSSKNFQLYTGAKAEADKNASDLRNVTGELDKLKLITGYAANVDVATIEATHTSDLTHYGANAQGVNEAKGYRNLLLQKEAELQGKIKELDAANAAKLALETQFKTVTEMNNAAKTQLEVMAQKASADLKSEKDNFVKTLDGIRAESQNIQQKLLQTEKDAKDAITQAKTDAAVAQSNFEKISTTNNDLNKKIAQMTNPVLVKEDGKITSVIQSKSVVVIDLGTASGLREGTTFSVFDPVNKDLAVAQPKGSIEVVQLLGSRSAEARILSTVLTDPIQSGDLIYTPVWKPGMKQSFALCGKMVVTGIGARNADRQVGIEDDLSEVRNLIHANGAEVDCYMDAEGTIFGKITPNTAFLVIGEGTSLDNAGMKSMIKLKQEAELNGVRTITLPELLRMMGWKNSAPVRGYGKQATYSDMEARPTKQMPVSSGTVSQLYMDKKANTNAKTSSGVVSQLYQESGGNADTSTGITSPLYQKDRTPVKSSTGNVSGIYGGK